MGGGWVGNRCLFASFKILQYQDRPSSSLSSSKFAFLFDCINFPSFSFRAGGSSDLTVFCCLKLRTDINHSLDRMFVLPQFFSGLSIFFFSLFLSMEPQSPSELIHSDIKGMLEKLFFSSQLRTAENCAQYLVS